MSLKSSFYQLHKMLLRIIDLSNVTFNFILNRSIFLKNMIKALKYCFKPIVWRLHSTWWYFCSLPLSLKLSLLSWYQLIYEFLGIDEKIIREQPSCWMSLYRKYSNFRKPSVVRLLTVRLIIEDILSFFFIINLKDWR